MEIKCPYCGTVGGLMTVHRHLVDHHLDQVVTQRDEETARMEYRIPCPFCEEVYQRQVKPRSRNPHFLVEFKAEIAMVAFDQMLHHILEMHPEEVGVDPAELQR